MGRPDTTAVDLTRENNLDRKYQEEQIKDTLQQIDDCKDVHELVELGRLIYDLRTVKWFVQGVWGKFKLRMGILREESKKKIAVVDVSQLFHASWYRTKGDPKATISSVLDRYSDIEADYPNSVVIAAADDSENFRHDLIDDWKGDRDEKPENFNETRFDCLDALSSNFATIIRISQYESDDIMASIAITSQMLGDDVYLITTDRDVWQVLSPQCEMHKPQPYTHEDLKQEHLITPAQAVEWMCLVGKNGVRGMDKIGAKRASEALSKYGSICGFLDAEYEKYQDEFDDFVKRLPILKRLHTLNKTLDVTDFLI